MSDRERDRAISTVALAFEGEGEAWTDPDSGDRLARTAVDALISAGLLPDPIETGREAALAQWEERWAQMRRTAQAIVDSLGINHSVTVGSVLTEMGKIEERIPTGLPVGDGRVRIELEPERAKRLIEVLRAAGAHPSGLGSYEAANDANAFADDIEGMV